MEGHDMLCPECGWSGARLERRHLECFMCGFRAKQRPRKARCAPPKPELRLLVFNDFYSAEGSFAKQWGLSQEALDELKNLTDT